MKKILMAFCVTLLFAVVAYAGEDAFSRVDTNRDGKIDRKEFERAVEKKFGTYDRNGDGVLSLSEIRDVQQNHKDAGVVEEFEKMDADKDGKVDLKEFKASAMKRFDEHDKNHDGVLDRPEVDYRTRYQDPESIMRPFDGFYF